MDGATLQAKIYSGYAKAALRIGLDADHYRPTGASNPTNAANKLRTIKASFNSEDMHYKKPNKYGKAIWWGLFDGRLTQPGDYLVVAGDGTYFIAAQQQALPILCVSCNVVIEVHRPQTQTGVGALPYGGNIDSTETALMTQWPASILIGGTGERADAVLPGDIKSPTWVVLLPKYGNVILRAGDIIKDNNAKRYIVGAAELTDLGWRLQAQQAVT